MVIWLSYLLLERAKKEKLYDFFLGGGNISLNVVYYESNEPSFENADMW